MLWKMREMQNYVMKYSRRSLKYLVTKIDIIW